MPRKRNPPKWKREGYRSEWAYRTAKAKAQGYAGGEAERRRIASLRETGLTPTERRRIKREVPIGPLPQAQARARNTPSQTRKAIAADVEWMHLENIAYAEHYRIEPSMTYPGKIPEELRSVNQEYRVKSTTFAESIRQYEIEFAKRNPGYVRDYYDAFVNTASNYEHFQALRKDGRGWYYDGGKHVAKGSAAFRQMVLRWAPKLENVTQYLNAAEFQSRYGTRDYA